MIRTTMQAQDTESLVIEMKVSMTLGEWLKLAGQLDESGTSSPAWDIKYAIRTTVNKINRQVSDEAQPKW